MNDEWEEDEEYLGDTLPNKMEEEWGDFEDDFVEEVIPVAPKIRTLPKLVLDWVDEADKASKYNEIPAAVICLNLLGQAVKDFVAIPKRGGSPVDTRLHFCWIQTSGTGKSALMNFALPISKKLWKNINEFEGYRENVELEADEEIEQFDNFDVVEYTAAALLGYQQPIKKTIMAGTNEEPYQGYDGETEIIDDWNKVRGELEGNGLARWDEFTNSGVFNTKSQHKEGIVTYLNTMTNTLHGESWVVTKKLKEGPTVECKSQRSILATTFPPRDLDVAIAETGLFQRMLMYIREVPESVQDEIREEIVDSFGFASETPLQIDAFTERLFEIYKLTKGRYNEVGGDHTKVVTFGPQFTNTLRMRKNDLMAWVDGTDGYVRDVAKNFMNRLLVILGKTSVLCCLAETADMPQSRRFIVTATHVNQAAGIIRNCYKSLVVWLETSLKNETVQRGKRVRQKNAKLYEIYNNMEKDEHGFIQKNEFIKNTANILGIGERQIIRRFDAIANDFETSKRGRVVFIKLRGEKK